MKLRVIDNQKIDSNDHHLYKITLTSKEPLSVSLSYLDPPVSHNKGYVFFADLDLYIEAPNNRIIVANIEPESREWTYTDSFATSEKVYIHPSDLMES